MKYLLLIILLMNVQNLQSQNYQIKNYMMGSSAATVSNSEFTLKSTVGQPAIGKIENLDNVIGSGFWYTLGKPADGMQMIALLSGWNLISSYIDPENTSIPVVWNEVKNNIVIVKNNAGATYIPAFDIDQIINWNVSEGYQVYASLADTLIVKGTQVVPESSPIVLNAGWNIISYLRNSELDCEIAFASITDNDNLVIVKDNFGNTYIPAYDINGIGNLIPGQGYQIYVLNNDQLIYPEN
jgi:hypothetical protein